MDSIHINTLPDSLDKENFISKYVENGNIDIEFIYGSDFKNAKILRDFIEVICKKIGFPEKEVSRFILIIDELNNNAIEYGTEKWWKNKIRIKTVYENEEVYVQIEVEDTWKGSKHHTALEMETLRAHQLKLWYEWHNSIRWRWLFMIIVNTVDRLYFRDSDIWWLIVWIRKKLKI